MVSGRINFLSLFAHIVSRERNNSGATISGGPSRIQDGPAGFRMLKQCVVNENLISRNRLMLKGQPMKPMHNAIQSCQKWAIASAIFVSALDAEAWPAGPTAMRPPDPS